MYLLHRNTYIPSLIAPDKDLYAEPRPDEEKRRKKKKNTQRKLSGIGIGEIYTYTYVFYETTLGPPACHYRTYYDVWCGRAAETTTLISPRAAIVTARARGEM